MITPIETGENLQYWIDRELPLENSLAVTVNFEELESLDYVVKVPKIGFKVAWARSNPT